MENAPCGVRFLLLSPRELCHQPAQSRAGAERFSCQRHALLVAGISAQGIIFWPVQTWPPTMGQARTRKQPQDRRNQGHTAAKRKHNTKGQVWNHHEQTPFPDKQYSHYDRQRLTNNECQLLSRHHVGAMRPVHRQKSVRDASRWIWHLLRFAR